MYLYISITLWQTCATAVQANPLGAVLGGGTVRPEGSFRFLRLVSGSVLCLRRLISRLSSIQWVLGEQDADGRDLRLHRHPWCSQLRTLPDLIHCLVVEFGHLVEPSHLALEDLHTGDCLGDSSPGASEDYLPQSGPDNTSTSSISFLYASCCEPQQIAYFAPFFDPHVQGVCCQTGDWVGAAVLGPAHSPKVAKFWRDEQVIRRGHRRVAFHYSAASVIWTCRPAKEQGRIS